MSYNIVFNQGTATVTVPAAESIAVQSYSATSVFNEVGFPNFPEVQDLLGVVENETTVFGPFAAGATSLSKLVHLVLLMQLAQALSFLTVVSIKHKTHLQH